MLIQSYFSSFSPSQCQPRNLDKSLPFFLCNLMRFFQAFSLLHRRTKSETFATGYVPPNQGSFAAVTNLNSRPSSLPAGLGSNKEDISSVFDFAIAKFTPLS